MKFCTWKLNTDELPLRMTLAHYLDEKSNVKFSEIFLNDKKSFYSTDSELLINLNKAGVGEFTSAGFQALMCFFLINKKNYDNWKLWLSPNCGFDPAVLLPFINYYNQYGGKQKITDSDVLMLWLQEDVKNKSDFSNDYKFITVTIKDIIKFYRSEFRKCQRRNPKASELECLDVFECWLQEIAVNYHHAVAKQYGYFYENEMLEYIPLDWFKFFGLVSKEIRMECRKARYANWGSW